MTVVVLAIVLFIFGVAALVVAAEQAARRWDLWLVAGLVSLNAGAVLAGLSIWSA